MAENENELEEVLDEEVNPVVEEEGVIPTEESTDGETEEEIPAESVEPVEEEKVEENAETQETNSEEESGSEYPVDMSDWYLPEDNYIETDPELIVKDWDDSKYKTDPKLTEVRSGLKNSVKLMAAAASTTAYYKLKSGSIAASGITIDADSGKTLDAYIKGNALYINGTKVIWYEE